MAKSNKAKARTLDFSKVKDRGNVSPTHRPEGDYLGTVLSCEDIKMGDAQRPAWLYIIKIGAGSYPYRCGFNENELWKIRNLFVASGAPVPKARQQIDPSKPVGRKVGITLQDHEYEGKMSSEIAAVFPPSDLDGDGTPVDDDEAETAEDVEGEDETPEPKAKKSKKGKKADPEPEPAKKGKGKKGGKKMDSLDIDDL